MTLSLYSTPYIALREAAIGILAIGNSSLSQGFGEDECPNPNA
jgi:hypothetical protein